MGHASDPVIPAVRGPRGLLWQALAPVLIASAVLLPARVLARTAAPSPSVVAAPMQSSGPIPTYPRLVKFPDAEVMSRVNALLAAAETADRQTRADCLAQLEQQKIKPDADSYSASISVSYLTRGYLSLEVTTSLYCGGPYPVNGAETPLTYDLRTGAPVDWSEMFKPDFLPQINPTENAPVSALTKLYRARYRPGPDPGDQECHDAIESQDPFSSPPMFYLDSSRGLVVQPDFPHVIAACADDMAVNANEIAPYLRNEDLAEDMKSAAPRPSGK